MGTAVSYTLPIYNAVVCNLALQSIRQEEAEQEQELLLSKTLESVTLSKDLLKLMGQGEFSDLPRESVIAIFVALCTLVDTSQKALVSIRTQLPKVDEKYQSALAAALDDFEKSTIRLEEICEAWGMASDENSVAEIKQALGDSKTKPGKEIPDWRDALASFSN